MLPRNMTIHLSIPFAVRLAVVVLLLGGTTARVWANAGPRSTSTKVVAEPVGIRNVRIDRETLTIDLRPLETGTFGIVEAVYHLQNDGPAQTLDLLFAFGTQTNSDFRVTFNDRPIAGNAVKQRMPDEWLPPRVTPGLTGSDALEYGAGWSTVLPQSFSIDVPVGPSVLAVRYRAEVKHTYALPAMYREFAYILAPARAWAGFGGLDVTIHPPPHWTVAVSPALPRDGDLLRGHFDAIPADAIGMTLRPPVAAGYQRVIAPLSSLERLTDVRRTPPVPLRRAGHGLRNRRLRHGRARRPGPRPDVSSHRSRAGFDRSTAPDRRLRDSRHARRTRAGQRCRSSYRLRGGTSAWHTGVRPSKFTIRGEGASH
jgi:hypothetical protein